MGNRVILNNLGFPDDWNEYIGKNVQGPAGGSLEWGSSNQAMIVYNGPFFEIVNLAKTLLGYSVRGVGGSLHRSLPHRHPTLPHMVCTRISNFQPYKFLRKATNAQLGTFAEYEFARCTAVYTNINYAIESDGDNSRLHNGDESYRFVIREYQPTVEAIQRPVGSFEYAETSATGPDVGLEVASGVTQLLTKAQLTLTWVNLPEYGTFDLNERPAIQEALLGKVNNATWRGYPAGTLLFKALKLDPVPAPFPIDFADVHRQWNMQFVLSFFDPPYGNANSRGHNLVPFPGDNLWYKVVSRDAGASTLYPTADFSTLFTLNG